MKPTDKQRNQFNRDGFIHVPGMLTQNQVETLRNAHESMIRGFADELDTSIEDYTRVVSQWTSVWEHREEFAKQLHDPKVAEFAAGLINASQLQLFHDQVISKIPNHSGSVPWHQDIPFWPVDTPGGVSCWIALDDATLESGSMTYMPGTHLEPVEHATDFLQNRKDWGNREQKQITSSPSAGDAIFHDARTWHTTPPNQTTGQRRAYIIIYLDGRVRYAPEKAQWAPVNKRATVESGQKLNRDRFPILWSTGP